MMGDPSFPMETDSDFQPFTIRERIQQLNEIDKKIVQIMSHTSEAIGALSIANADDTAAQKATFKEAMDSFITTLHAVDVHMKRQIMGLEEAGIIDLSNERTEADLRSGAKASLSPNAVGSVGNLDVGLLNSRSGKVEKNMEAELWAKGREFLEKTKAEKDGAEAMQQ